MTKADLASGLFIALLIIIFGIVIMFSKSAVWSVFQIFYRPLGVEAQPSRFWPMLVDTIGLSFVAVGMFVSWKVWQRWRNRR